MHHSNIPDVDTPIDAPTWYADIRYLFTEVDIDCMKARGLDLAIYEQVKSQSANIYGQVSTKMMPKTGPWPDAWVATFRNWMANDCPKGVPSGLYEERIGITETTSNASRIRKDVTDLSVDEVSQLKRAFEGIVSLDPTDPNSYFILAGYHWLPAPSLYCQHHSPGYNPWHRAYLLRFENALRSIPGCADVTLPYWDITRPFPELLKQAPFDRYELPQRVSDRFPSGYVTERYSYSQIQQNLDDYQVVDDLNRALGKTDWEDFHGWWSGATNNTIIAAHDGGHVAFGPTLADQDIAAFEPAFWFFHCNWDRLFWKWQKNMDATTLTGLLSTINSTTDPISYQLFTDDVLKNLKPFTNEEPHVNSVDIIDSENSLDVDYQDPPTEEPMRFLAKSQLEVPVHQKFAVTTQQVDVRVHGINRLKIPGSFRVFLLKDETVIASRAMFQPDEAEKCENCVSNPIAQFDFFLPLDQIVGGKLSVKIEPVRKDSLGLAELPSDSIGDPKIDVHLLLETD